MSDIEKYPVATENQDAKVNDKIFKNNYKKHGLDGKDVYFKKRTQMAKACARAINYIDDMAKEIGLDQSSAISILGAGTLAFLNVRHSHALAAHALIRHMEEIDACSQCLLRALVNVAVVGELEKDGDDVDDIIKDGKVKVGFVQITPDSDSDDIDGGNDTKSKTMH